MNLAADGRAVYLIDGKLAWMAGLVGKDYDYWDFLFTIAIDTIMHFSGVLDASLGDSSDLPLWQSIGQYLYATFSNSRVSLHAVARNLIDIRHCAFT